MSGDLFGDRPHDDTVRAISLWQPWASAVALGMKRNETRHWSTSYRGPLAIHAAKRWTREQREFAQVERAVGRGPSRVPLGAIVAICRLVDVVPTDLAKLSASPVERIYGNYEPGRFAWVLEDIHPLAEPIGWRGGQGFFRVPASLFADLVP